MENRGTVSARILIGGTGMGLPDPEMLSRRAWEIALIEGREAPNSNDWAEASRELHGRGEEPDEEGQIWAGETTGVAGAGGEGLFGGRGEVRVGDPVVLGEELIREGLEEAEHERMLRALEPVDGEELMEE